MAFKTTLSFGINSLCSYSSELDQIQIMWPFWPKLPLYEKTLAFKGHEGQERPSNFLFVKFWEVKPMRKSFFFKNMQFLLKQNLSMVEYEGVYFTSAWPFWPLKAKFFHQNISFCKCVTWCEFHYFATTSFRLIEKVQNRSQSTVPGPGP